jgi:hypothetical protein
MASRGAAFLAGDFVSASCEWRSRTALPVKNPARKTTAKAIRLCMGTLPVFIVTFDEVILFE